MLHRLLTLSAIISATSAMAAEPLAPDTLRLSEVQVVTTAKAPVALLPLDLTTITAGDIQKSSESTLLPVLRNHVPGMFVTERGMAGYGVSGGAAGQVSIRGVGGGNKVLFLIDGEPQWAGVFGHSLPDTYVTGNIDRVEVISGPSSLLYGSNAMGGSVNIITKKATVDGFKGYVRGMLGSYNTQKYNINLSYKKGPWRAMLSGSYDRSDGTRENSQFWLANQYASLQYDFSEHWSAGANAVITETDSHNPGETYAPMIDGWARMIRTSSAIYVQNSYGVTSGGLRVYCNTGRHKVADGHTADQDPRGYLFRSTDDNIGLTLYQNIKPWRANNLSVGFDLKRWGGHTWYDYLETQEIKEEVDKHVTEVAGYAMMQQGLWSDRLSLNAGVRVENSSQFGTEVIPQAGFILKAFKGSSLKFSFGKGYRSPNIRELYIQYYSITTPAGTFTGPCNPDLRPESMLNYEIELRQRFLDGRLDAGLSLYYIDGKDLIESVKREDGPGMVLTNTGAFTNKGFELDVRYSIAADWNFNANYAYLHTDRRILHAPKNKLFAELMWHPGGWEISLENMNIWGMYSAATVSNSYSLLNSRIAYTFKQVAGITPRAFAKLDNITNTRYQIMDGYPMPGFTVMAGVELRF